MRIVRRLVHVLVIVLTLVVGAAAAAVIVSQTAWFKNWLRGYIVREANQYLNGTLSIERLGGNLFFGVEMENIGVSMDGSQVVAVKDLGLDYNVFELIAKGLSVDSIRLDKPVHLPAPRRRHLVASAGWSRSRQQEADRSGPGEADRHRRRSASATARSSSTAPVGHVRRRRAEALRSPRREAVVQVRAGAVLDRDHARVVPRLRSGDRAERAVGRRRRDGRHAVRRQARAADRGNVAVDRRRRAALPDDAGRSTCRSASDKLSLPEIARARAGARGHPAAAGVRAEG